MVEQAHDCHHGEHSLFTVGLKFVVLFDEWLKAWPWSFYTIGLTAF
jgi:hypothetical protein